MKTKIAAALLVVLGVAQMTGDVLHARPLKWIAAATGASPAPKVFTAFDGFEPFSARLFIDRTEMTPELYGRLRGPYNRRNVYGAVLAGGPVVPPPLREPVIQYALCDGAPLLRELGMPVERRATPPVVRIIQPTHSMRFEAACR